MKPLTWNEAHHTFDRTNAKVWHLSRCCYCDDYRLLQIQHLIIVCDIRIHIKRDSQGDIKQSRKQVNQLIHLLLGCLMSP